MNLRQKAKNFKRKYEELLATKPVAVIEHPKLQHYRVCRMFHIPCLMDDEFVYKELSHSIAGEENMLGIIQSRMKIESIDDLTCKATFDFWVEI